MKLIIPVKLKFHYNDFKHKGCMATRFYNNELNLINNIKAVVANSLKEGLGILEDDIRDWIEPQLQHGVEMNDFTLVYSSDDIIDGRAWGGAGVVSETKLN